MWFEWHCVCMNLYESQAGARPRFALQAGMQASLDDARIMPQARTTVIGVPASPASALARRWLRLQGTSGEVTRGLRNNLLAGTHQRKQSTTATLPIHAPPSRHIGEDYILPPALTCDSRASWCERAVPEPSSKADADIVAISPAIPAVCPVVTHCRSLVIKFRFSGVGTTQCPRN
jgi:hypothetical protein